MGYPTQKPLKLLDRIIKASSKPDDLILNPFCGCGTAVDAANRLGRRWAGIDISSFAIDLICGKRLKDRTIPVKGIPFRSRAASEAVANTGRIRVAGYPYRRTQLWPISDYFDERLPAMPIMADPYSGKPLEQGSLF